MFHALIRLHSLRVLSFALWLIPVLSSACSVCGCGDPLASSGSAHPLANSFRLDFETILLDAGAASDDNQTQIENLRQVNLNTTLTYSPTNDIALVAMFPLVEKYWSLTSGNDPIVPGATLSDSGTPFGIGDIMLGARYFFWQETNFKTKQHQAFALSGGLYLPTGDTQILSGFTGGPIDAHAQLGTGGYGFYGGVLYNHVWNDFTLSANANIVAHTTAITNDPGNAMWEYTFGTSYTGGISGQLKIADPLAAGFAIEGRYANADTEPIAAPSPEIYDTPNTGGTVVDLSPSLYWNVSGNSVLYGKVQIPVYTDFIGLQTIGPTYIFGTQFLLD